MIENKSCSHPEWPPSTLLLVKYLFLQIHPLDVCRISTPARFCLRSSRTVNICISQLGGVYVYVGDEVSKLARGLSVQGDEGHRR